MIKNVIHFTSNIIMLLGLFMVFPLIVSLIEKDSNSIVAFLATILVCLLLNIISHIFIKKTDYKFKYRDGFITTTVIWIVSSLIGSLPYIFSGEIPNFFDALFESVSGFSTTGSTILPDIEIISKPLLLYRSMTNWIGGMGIVVLLSAVLSSWGINGQTIAFNESTGPSKSKLTSRFSDSSKILYLFYVMLTLIEIILLKLAGMTWFDSINHSFSTISTGGFSIYNDGLLHYGNPMIQIIVIVFMLLGGTNFNLLLSYKSNRSFKVITHDDEIRFYYLVVFLASFIIFIYNFIYMNFKDMGKTLLDAIFQVTSIITTTGFVTTDYELWPTFTRMILFSLFFIGACASSTSGGIKSIRILLSIKLIKRSISLKLHPNRIANITINDKEVPSDTVIRVTTFIFTYAFILFTGTLLLSLGGFDLITNLSAAASSLGNVGPGFGMVGPSYNFSSFTNLSKLICSILMIIGRLELFPVFVLFSKNYWRPNRVK